MCGKTTRASISNRRFLVTSSQSFKASHSLATASNVLALSSPDLILSSFFCWDGCIPCLTSRSEEHTSELQSLMRISYAVFCLKKKKTQINDNIQSKNIAT